MPASNTIIKETKKKFVFFSVLGLIAVTIISVVSLNSYSHIIQQQASMQKLYLKLNKHFAEISEIAILSEKFSEPQIRKDETIQKFKDSVYRLESQNKSLHQWLQNVEKIDGNDRDKSLQVFNRTKTFIKKAKELIDNDRESPEDLKDKVRVISYGARDGIGDVISNLSLHIAKEQQQSLSALKNAGFALVTLCILQIVLVWLLVFKPLYNTIIIQHEKLNDAMLSVESASRAKTDFLANISHEIRTPMTAIMGYSNLLRTESLEKEEKADAIKTIDHNASHLLSLIDEILDISKIEAGKFEFESEKVNLSALLNEVYSLINVKAVEKNIKLNFKNKGSIPEYIQTDPKRIKQILFNIIGNAIKFTDQGNVELIVSTRIETNHLVIHIKDTGCGIEKGIQEKLFKPFEQGDSSVNRKFGGTGLGLVLSKGLAQGMSGDINIVESQIGLGTTFEVLIDMGDVNKDQFISSFSTNIDQEDPIEIIHDDSLKDKNILVVDDAKENARLFKMYLTEAGAHVEMAHNGQEAIDLALSMSFDMMLLDLQMPGKDGFQVIKELKGNGFNKPIAALTAHAMKEQKEKTKMAGFDGHITKPVKPDELIQSVLFLMKKHESRLV